MADCKANGGYTSETCSNINGSKSEDASRGPSAVPPERAPRLAVTVRDFTYGKLLGLGSFSKVVLATYKGDGQEYALKVMAKQLIVRERKVKQVKRERVILDQLDHLGIVRMHFTFQDQASLYMAMECCHGGDLFDQIRRRGPMPEDAARFYAAEMVCILEYLHRRGVIHRDLKPENLLLTSDGHLKLGDFGSATVERGPGTPTDAVRLALEDEGEAEARNGSFVGTADYISPEVLNSQPASTASDLWALGCIMFQLLEGRPPFRGASEYLTFQKVLKRDYSFSPTSRASEQARDLVGQLLQIEPGQRIGSKCPGGFAMLKSHHFFEGIDFSTCLWGQDAPVLQKEAPAGGTSDECDDDEEDENESSDDEGAAEWEVAHLGGSLSGLRC